MESALFPVMQSGAGINRSFIKQAWDIMPDPVRRLVCSSLLHIWAKKRSGAIIRDPAAPYYVCGAFRNNAGVSQGARLYADELEATGKKVIRIDMTEPMRLAVNYSFNGALKSNGRIPGNIIIHANPPQLMFCLKALDKNFLRKSYLTVFWAYESSPAPSYWLSFLPYIDSIETPSRFSGEIFKKYFSLPVALHPYAIRKAVKKKKVFAEEGIIRCLYIFDGGPSWKRKNPEAALSAFRKAFKPGKARITFKINNASPKQLHDFSEACAKIPGTRIITDNFSPEQLEELYLQHDIYLSLHRSEGYGLTIREALNYGLKVVATGYGGNMEFMDNANAWPVPVSADNSEQRLPEPDINIAAEILSQVASQLYCRIGQND